MRKVTNKQIFSSIEAGKIRCEETVSLSNRVNLDFTSRECKNVAHHTCHNKWEGMGFEIICACNCGHRKDPSIEKLQYSGSLVGRRDQSVCKTQTIHVRRTNLNDD